MERLRAHGPVSLVWQRRAINRIRRTTGLLEWWMPLPSFTKASHAGYLQPCTVIRPANAHSRYISITYQERLEFRRALPVTRLDLLIISNASPKKYSGLGRTSRQKYFPQFTTFHERRESAGNVRSVQRCFLRMCYLYLRNN